MFNIKTITTVEVTKEMIQQMVEEKVKEMTGMTDLGSVEIIYLDEAPAPKKTRAPRKPKAEEPVVIEAEDEVPFETAKEEVPAVVESAPTFQFAPIAESEEAQPFAAPSAPAFTFAG